jgi:hypothetical protein
MQYKLMERILIAEAYIRKNCRIFRIRFPGISVPSKSSVTAFWRRSFPEHAMNYLSTYLCEYVYNMRKCKVLDFAVSQGFGCPMNSLNL